MVFNDTFNNISGIKNKIWQVIYNITKKNGGTDTKTMDQTEPHFLSDPMSDRKKVFANSV
jgi:hypothetical protein